MGRAIERTSIFVLGFLALSLLCLALPAHAQTLDLDPASTGTWSGDITMSCSGTSSGDLTFTDTGGHFKYIDIYSGSVGSATLVNGHFVGSSAGNTFTGDCTTAGSPLFAVAENASDVTAFRAYFTGGGSPPNTSYGGAYGDSFIPPVPPDERTRIEWVNPPKQTPAATTTSQTISFQFNYYLNSAVSSTTLDSKILLQLCPLSYPSDPCQKATVLSGTVADSLQSVSASVTTTRQGYYLGLVSFWNGVASSTAPVVCDWWNPFCSPVAAQVIHIEATASNNFNVASTTIPADIPIGALDVQSMCAGSSGILDSAVCSAVAFLFVPSPDSMQKLVGVKDELLTKVPFYYFSVPFKAFNNIAASTTVAAGANIVWYMGSTMGTTTMIDFVGVHNYIGSLIPQGAEDVIGHVAWIIASLGWIAEVIHFL